MKFTKPNENGILCNKFFDTYREAKEHFKEGVQPVLSLQEWSKTSKDYKGIVDGQTFLLYLTDKGTTYGQCNVVYDV